MGTKTPPRTDRAERLLDLVSFLLGAAGPVTWADLVEAFPRDYGTGTPTSCQRKWDRDRSELVELGIPIERVAACEERPGGYVIDRRRYFMGDLDLTTEERALLSVAGAAALAQPHFPLRADLAHALDKLLFEAPVGAHPLSRQLVVHLPARGAERKAGVLEALGRAVQARKTVSLRYRSFAGGITEREVRPYGLAYRRGAWFLVGHCLLREGLRTFQVERIEALRPNAASPGKPDYDVPAGFDPREVVGREPWEYAVHPPVEAKVRLGTEAAILARGRFGERAAIRQMEDGGAEVRLPVTYGEALVREILSLAPHAELVSPASLREQVAAAALTMAAAHRAAPLDVRESVPPAETAGRGAAPLEVQAADTRSGEVAGRGVAPLDVQASVSPAETAGRGAAQLNVQASVTFGETAGRGVGPAVSARDSAYRGEGLASAGSPTDSAAQGARDEGRSDLRERLRRALFLIPYAVANPGSTIRELAEATRLPEEGLLEELDFLRMVGRPPFSPADLIDIDVSDGRVHVSLPQGLLRPPSLTPLEAAALAAAASTLAVEGGEALATARQKLRAAIRPEGREQFDRVAGLVVLDHGSLDPDVAAVIDRAIAERRELSLTYWTASRGEAGRRTVRPLERVLHQGYWYLYAYCNTRRDRRLFRLDRAADLTLLETTFVPRQVDRDARFHRDSLYAPAPHAAFARVRIEDGPWAQAGMIERMGGTLTAVDETGAALAEFPADGDAFVVSAVLSLAGVARLETPPGLRERIRGLAEEVARLHGA